MRTIAGRLTRADASTLTGASLVFRAATRVTLAGVPDAPPAEAEALLAYDIAGGV